MTTTVATVAAVASVTTMTITIAAITTIVTAVRTPTLMQRLLLHRRVRLSTTQLPPSEIHKQTQRDEVQDPVSDQPIQHARVAPYGDRNQPSYPQGWGDRRVSGSGVGWRVAVSTVERDIVSIG
jgi:hypothetical protein